MLCADIARRRSVQINSRPTRALTAPQRPVCVLLSFCWSIDFTAIVQLARLSGNATEAHTIGQTTFCRHQAYLICDCEAVPLSGVCRPSARHDLMFFICANAWENSTVRQPDVIFTSDICFGSLLFSFLRSVDWVPHKATHVIPRTVIRCNIAIPDIISTHN